MMRQDGRVDKESISIMFSALSTSIQSRLPPLPSIRRSMTGGPFLSPFASGATTPNSEAESLFSEQTRVDGSAVAEALALHDGSVALTSDFAGTPTALSQRSGVDWRCGQQGWCLLLRSVSQLTLDPRNLSCNQCWTGIQAGPRPEPQRQV